MATQDVDFKVGDGSLTNDTGNPGNPDEAAGIASIKNYSAGERVRASVFNRPIENLRKRTETLRTEVSAQKYLQDTDIKWVISGGDATGTAYGNANPMVTWNHTTGKFTVSSDIVVQPLMGPKADKKGSITYTGTGWTITLGTSLYRFQGGHLTSVHWTEVAPGTLSPNRAAATVTWEPYATLNIQICNDGTTLVSDITTALFGIGGGFTHSETGGASYVSLSDIKVAGVVNPLFTFSGTYDREIHHIPESLLVSFFATKSITNGDTLCLGYEWLINPDGVTYSGRRQATPSSGYSTVLLPGQLFLADENPEKIPLAIPICKRIGDDLIFIDGTITTGHSVAVHFGLNEYFFETYSAYSGAAAVGVASHNHHSPTASTDYLDISAGTVQSTLEALQAFTNDKAACDHAEMITGAWHLGTTTYFTPASAIASAPLKLLWRSSTTAYTRPSDSQISWSTISKYSYSAVVSSVEKVYDVTVQGAYLEIVGGVLLAHTPLTGMGSLTVTIDSVGGLDPASVADMSGTFKRTTASPNVTYSIITPAVAVDFQVGQLYFMGNLYSWATSYAILATTLSIGAQTIALSPKTEVVTTGSKIVINPAPTLASANSGLGVTDSAYFNRVLEGFMVLAAATPGNFGIDTITFTPGRAIVAGNVITIPEARTLTNVVDSHMLPYTTLPANAGYCKWYGVWLRSDGAIKLGPLPFMDTYHACLPAADSYIPGKTMYMLPLNDGTVGNSYTESGYDRSDYTLINIAWSYQGNVAGAIRFAGMTHVGGNLWVYQQAHRGAFTAPYARTYYIDHTFWSIERDYLSATPVQDLTVVNTNSGLSLPGVPTALSRSAVINAQIYVGLANANSEVDVSLLPGISVATTHLSLTYTAPPAIGNPSDETFFTSYDLAFTVAGSVYYASPVWSKYTKPVAAGENSYATDTVNFPFLTPPSLLNTNHDDTGCLVVGDKYTLGAGDVYGYKFRTHGFFWDRYNAGGLGY